MKRSEKIREIEDVWVKGHGMAQCCWFNEVGFLLSEVKRMREVVEEWAGFDCYNYNLFTEKICGICPTCVARHVLSDDEVPG